MPQKFKNGLSLLAFMLTLVTGMAQDQKDSQQRLPRWVSDKGYWVIETNINAPLDHQVSFYTNENVLLFKKSFTGIKLDPDKRKVKMKFKKILDSALLARQKERNEQAEKNEVLAGINAVPL